MAEDYHWYKGSRRVWVFPRLGLAVKICRIYWRESWKHFSHLSKYVTTQKILRDVGIDHIAGPTYYLLKGIRDNWMEFVFFWKSRSDFLQPTYFSLFGFINIQKYGEILDKEKSNGAEVWQQFFEITHQDHMEDSHHFDNCRNFCIDESGRLRIVDYGSPATRQIISKWGDILHEKVTLTPKS